MNTNFEAVVDMLTYRSWYYQVVWYKMPIQLARKIFKDARLYEQKAGTDPRVQEMLRESVAIL